MPERIFTLSDFQFELPDELIAQEPSQLRDRSRLLVLDRNTGLITHTVFNKISDYLNNGDVLVFNDAKVINARLFCKRSTGGAVEVVLARRISGPEWMVITNRTARLNAGEKLFSISDPSISMDILGREGEFVRVKTEPVFTRELLDRIGSIPLPPYIRRDFTENDRTRYQTIYASQGEAAAAPTAGLHFTQELLEDIRTKGIETHFLTLDVSWGTFQPVREQNLSLHHMHTEGYNITSETASALNIARKEGRRIIPVGTTSLRVLETVFNGNEYISGKGDTDIFIYPPRTVRSADCLVTNFHTPGSTLLMLVCSFGGYERMLNVYNTAVEMGYRFFSYGDAMLIL